MEAIHDIHVSRTKIVLDALVGIVLGAAVWWVILWGVDESANLARGFGAQGNPLIPLALAALGIGAATLFIEKAPWRLAGAAGVLLLMWMLGQGYAGGTVSMWIEGDLGWRLLRTAHDLTYMATTAVWVGLAARRLYAHLRSRSPGTGIDDED